MSASKVSDGTCPHKRDASTGWLQSRSGGVPPNFFMFIGFSLPKIGAHFASITSEVPLNMSIARLSEEQDEGQQQSA